MLDRANKVLKILNEANHEAYIVGGAVRDIQMGLIPSDIDITTSANPEEVISLFPQNYPSGIEFGTVTVMVDEESFEVTTFRTDGEYLDGRRPEVVTFGKTIEEDLSRRDFTINAMAMDINGEIIDTFDGRNDLQKGIIKAVGNPVQRFSEDALRILRAFRFSARFRFTIEAETLNAIKETREGLILISTERIRDEIFKILMTDNVLNTFTVMYKTGVLDIILPEIAKMYGVEQNHPHHMYDVFTHTMISVENAPKDLTIRLAMLLHDIGKPYTKETVDGVDRFHEHHLKSVEIAIDILSRLNVSNKIKNEVLELISLHDREIIESPKAVRRLLNQLQYTSLENLLAVKKADAIGQNSIYLKDRLTTLNNIQKIASNQPKLTVKNLAVNGHDMMALGLQGKDIGDMLNYLLDLVLDDTALNQTDTLMDISQKKLLSQL